ncbi:MAG: AAA family ATPase [Thermococci archaeon]|nr:AAA family ATPase [Thermococci archaeon]
MRNIIDRAKTGVPGLDKLIEGGFPRGATVTVTGPPGTGKTTLSAQFIYKGVELYNEPGVIVLLEERPQDFRREMLGFGWDFKKYEDAGKVIIIDGISSSVGIPSTEKFVLEEGLSVDEFLRYIYRAIKAIGAKRLVIDSIPSVSSLMSYEGDIRNMILKLNILLAEMGVTSVLVSEVTSLEADKLSRYEVEEFLSKGVIQLGYITGKMELKRYILIRKMSQTMHSLRLHPLEVTKSGLVVYPEGL